MSMLNTLDKKVADMTGAELAALIETSVEHSFSRVSLPIDTSGALLDAQKDFLFLRSLRQSSEAAKNRIVMAVVGTLMATLVMLVTLGTQSWLKDHQ